MFGSPGGGSRRPALRRDSPGRRLPPGASSSPLQASGVAAALSCAEQRAFGAPRSDRCSVDRSRTSVSMPPTARRSGDALLPGVPRFQVPARNHHCRRRPAKFDCCLTLVTLLCRTMTSSEREAGKKSSS
ncbi:hypothetical protein PVAP13_6KG055000 [Panicum virgatum]|uniref:Uncharacterized protein n=1 Tax=Panicum virgatum TaxID=38727 RepID=A0A8T0R7A4_PANVG|nr:hypothetical protein PVAP13_6KG055000 [Panicum virgatum]